MSYGGEEIQNKRRYEILLQDMGLLLFLISIYFIGVLVYLGGLELLFENVIMLFFTTVAIILITFNVSFGAILVIGIQIISYTIYKVFNMYENGMAIRTVHYFWLALPIVAVGAIKLFCIGKSRLELENANLKTQVEELVMIEPITGLYNLKSFYYDMEKNIKFAKRYEHPLTLMLIKLRYASELNKLLSDKNFKLLKRRIAEIISDSIRKEDNQYSIDKDGGMALVLTCDKEGAEVVKKRIKELVEDKHSFDNIGKSIVRVEVQIAYLQYSEEYGDNIMYFKDCVERELQYDV